MKNFLGMSVGMALVLCGGTAAWAGLKNTSAVTIDAVNRTASGSLGTARNTTDLTQYIGCSTYSYYNGLADELYCSARTAAGATLTCTSKNASLVANARALTGDSHLYFQADAAGQCLIVQVNNYSYYEPKK